MDLSSSNMAECMKCIHFNSPNGTSFFLGCNTRYHYLQQRILECLKETEIDPTSIIKIDLELLSESNQVVGCHNLSKKQVRKF